MKDKDQPMECEQAQAVLADRRPASYAGEKHRAEQHVAACADCDAAAYAMGALAAASERPVPGPSPHAFERAMIAASRVRASRRGRYAGFLSGTAVGAGLAASLAYAIVMLWPAALPEFPAGVATPTVELRLAEVGDVAIAVYSEQALAEAEIRVSVTGDLGIDGFAEQRELRWLTRLDRGVNELTLPIVALGEAGGQIVVAVRGGGQSRSFLVDVKTQPGRPGAG